VCCALTVSAEVAVAKVSVPEPVVLVLGDSLSAEYGLKRGTGWVSLLGKQLAQGARPAKVINVSVSGETTAGGRSRLPALLKQYKPTHVILELGANDALRGLALDATHANLQAMAMGAKAMGAKVLLVGIQIPPNYGRQYSEDFARIFSKLAQVERLALVPFLLKGVADNPQAAELFQPDRIHPNEQAQQQMLNNVWPVLKSLL
jgi:acyl-CoA thioesterase-1